VAGYELKNSAATAKPVQKWPTWAYYPVPRWNFSAQARDRGEVEAVDMDEDVVVAGVWLKYMAAP